MGKQKTCQEASRSTGELKLQKREREKEGQMTKVVLHCVGWNRANAPQTREDSLVSVHCVNSWLFILLMHFNGFEISAVSV